MASQVSARDRCLDIPELSDKLASMLKLQDYAACMQVCRHWHQLWVRHLFATSYGSAQAPYFPQHGHHVRTLDWRRAFLPDELDQPRIHCGNLKVILLPKTILTWDDFWTHFLGLDPQTIPTFPSHPESSYDDNLVEQFELGDIESKEWDRELSSLKGEANAFLSDSIEVMSLRTPFAPLVLNSLTGARIFGDNVLPNLKELTMTDESPDSKKPALRPRHILAFLDAFPSLERLIFSNINLTHNADNPQSKEAPCPSYPLSYAMSQPTFNLSELSLPQIDSLLALSQVLRLVPRLQRLELRQTWRRFLEWLSKAQNPPTEDGQHHRPRSRVPFVWNERTPCIFILLPNFAVTGVHVLLLPLDLGGSTSSRFNHCSGMEAQLAVNSIFGQHLLLVTNVACQRRDAAPSGCLCAFEPWRLSFLGMRRKSGTSYNQSKA
ncbi:hypothetical protein BGX26_011764 [Mortierella sp. AD094]|nr:hypothetical protein BGX26_011764 [Mortierella sp. AD094]